MAELETQPEASRQPDWRDECARDAAALADRLGAEGVAWLDSFLADYVFPDEPLDQVLLKAREMSRLPHRSG